MMGFLVQFISKRLRADLWRGREVAVNFRLKDDIVMVTATHKSWPRNVTSEESQSSLAGEWQLTSRTRSY